jgi:DNA gyrase inhibitor GyrI
MKPQRRTHMKSVRVLVLHDAQTDMLPGEPGGAICVQRFDDSLSSAIHITYRSWLRSSSMHEPRDPPLEVVLLSFLLTDPTVLRRRILEVLKKFSKNN